MFAEKSLHLVKLVEEKYRISERVPKQSKDGKLLLPSCSNSYLFQLTKTWDKGSRAVREKILKEFVQSMQNATGPQLERELNNGASLFLTRISSWLRLTYLLGYDIALQLSAVTIFISAASGNRFLTEFLEVGGLLTVLEILTITQAKEADRAEALHLLIQVASNGRKYKEFICESYGVRQVTECLSRSKSEITQDYARNMLVSLGTGNPKFQLQVFKGLQSLLSSNAVAPTSQQMAAQALRSLLAITPTVPPSLIDPAASLLRSQHMQVQYEGYELLRELVHRSNCQDTILLMLVSILRNVFEPSQSDDRNTKDTKQQWAVSTTEDQKEKERLLSGYIQQAYASKLVGVLIASSVEVTEKLLKFQLVSALLNVIANVSHPESQKYATSNLIYLVHNFDYVALAIRENMGENFFELIENKPDTFYRELTKEQVRYLRRNNIKIRQFGTVDKEVDSEEDSESDQEDQKNKKHAVAFPGSYPKEEQSQKIELEQIQNPTQTITNETESKLQQIILDQYEQYENGTKKMVEDVYSQFQHQSGISATFSVNKFVNQGMNLERVQFDNDLEQFKSVNKQRKEQKKSFEPTLQEDINTHLQSLLHDKQLFSHEKMAKDIQKHLVTTDLAGVMSSDDQAMLMLEKKLQNNFEQEPVEFETEEEKEEIQKETMDEPEQEIALKKQVSSSLEDIENMELDETAGDDWDIPISSEKNSQQLNDIEPIQDTLPMANFDHPASLDVIREVD